MRFILVVAVLAFMGVSLASAAPVPDDCGAGWVWKDLEAPWEYHGAISIDRVAVKVGRDCLWFPDAAFDPETACYVVGGWAGFGGLGTPHLQVKFNSGQACPEVLHVEYFSGFVSFLPLNFSR